MVVPDCSIADPCPTLDAMTAPSDEHEGRHLRLKRCRKLLSLTRSRHHSHPFSGFGISILIPGPVFGVHRRLSIDILRRKGQHFLLKLKEAWDSNFFHGFDSVRRSLLRGDRCKSTTSYKRDCHYRWRSYSAVRLCPDRRRSKLSLCYRFSMRP